LVRPRMFGAKLWVRMPPEYVAALKAFAFQSDVPLAEYVRDMVHDHILERGAALRALINAFAYRKASQSRSMCARWFMTISSKRGPVSGKRGPV
jgi:hypothetical protein